VFGASATLIASKVLSQRLGAEAADTIQLFGWQWLPTQLPLFCMGFFTYFLIREVLQGEEERIRPFRSIAPWLLGTSAYLMFACSFSEPRFFLGQTLFGFAFILLIGALALHANPVLVNPFTCGLGVLSYSAYMTHFIALDLALAGLDGALSRIGPGAVRNLTPLVQLVSLMVLTLILTVLASLATFRWIEIPGQAWGKRLISWADAKTVQSAREPLAVELLEQPEASR
jgi:peptidoglycan/LPS O-acetylase OafA/YrhL